jgi:CRISPR-associated protein Cmr4
MTTRLTFIHALSPLHAGTGQGIGVIDLPIAREKATNIPYLPGSSLKGSIRDCHTNQLFDKYFKELQDEKEAKKKADQEAARIFGEAASEQAYAGSAVFSDQRLLLLPARSLRGTFAWATSPYTLQRFKRDAEVAGVDVAGLSGLPEIRGTTCLVAQEKSELTDEKRQVFLEDFDLQGETDPAVDDWARFIGAKVFEDENWRKALTARLCILSDNVFNFLLEHGTEITARVRLEEKTKTVASGALWYEEALPAETILSGLLVTVNGKAAPEEVFATVGGILKRHKAIQLGGKATVGRGLCRIRLDNDGKGAAQ